MTDRQNKSYNPSEIERKWQKIWDKEGIYKFRIKSKHQPKYYPLVEWPYPSGDLHIGHWFSFATADVHARTMRMMGKNVFFTNGFDAFGLPAENAAIKRGVHPKNWTYSNIENMRKQFGTMGTMIDWSHEAIACDPAYYKWNQWIFIKMFEKGLAYRGKMLGNWCPTDQTVLANEHAENGKCWRCGTQVVQKEVEQWFLKLTAYADRLLWPDCQIESVKRQASNQNTDKKPPSILNANDVDWPVSVKTAQNQWIGKKEGINITYSVIVSSTDSVQSGESLTENNLTVTVFTTRPETNFGASFIAIAPEHPLIDEILKQVQNDKKKEIEKYINKAKKKSELERQSEIRRKTGVFTGFYAINQLTGYNMPIWISDFVLMGFGTGALVGVPGHDRRDFEFARKFSLDIKRVIVGTDNDRLPITKIEQVQEGEGTMINSDFLNGMKIQNASKKMMEYMESQDYGKRTTTYHIHDWSISRQRYWGTPVPMIHCPKCGIVPVSFSDLPVELPYDVDYTPKGKPPLATNRQWLAVKCPKCHGSAQRDSETLDTFFDSSWYFFRYLDPEYDKKPFPIEEAQKILPVDIYFGGAEHTLGHTLYARFFTKFFHDIGLYHHEEFALRRVQHGVILGTDGNRMSKSKGNVVNPDDVVAEFGADAARMYLCFMMPYAATAPWDTKGIWGVYKFLKRVWDLQFSIMVERGGKFNPDQGVLTITDLYQMHKAIRKVGKDIAATKFNTAVSALMIWLNHLEGKSRGKGIVSLEEYKHLLLLLAPFAPHMTEEIWQRLQPSGLIAHPFESIHQQDWPIFDPQYLVSDQAAIAVQVNGKLRKVLKVSTLLSEKEISEYANKDSNIAKYLSGRKIKKIIYVPGKVLNFVVA